MCIIKTQATRQGMQRQTKSWLGVIIKYLTLKVSRPVYISAVEKVGDPYTQDKLIESPKVVDWFSMNVSIRTDTQVAKTDDIWGNEVINA